MICDIYFEYLSESLEYRYRKIYSSVDLDYWNIRQWRKLYFELSKEKEKYKDSLFNVHLQITPCENNIVFKPPNSV